MTQATCLECGAPEPGLSLLCERCEPQYARDTDRTEPCNCNACRSDMAGIVPCEGDEK